MGVVLSFSTAEIESSHHTVFLSRAVCSVNTKVVYSIDLYGLNDAQQLIVSRSFLSFRNHNNSKQFLSEIVGTRFCFMSSTRLRMSGGGEA